MEVLRACLSDCVLCALRRESVRGVQSEKGATCGAARELARQGVNKSTQAHTKVWLRGVCAREQAQCSSSCSR